jgi:transmembrane sensor
MEPISKDMVHKYFSGQVTPMQKRIIQSWIEDPQNENQYFLWLEEWERNNIQFSPQSDIAFEKFKQSIQSERQEEVINEEIQISYAKSFISDRVRKYLGIAASLLVIIVLGIVFQSQILYKTYTTGPGNISKITLPDSSVIILNTNSKLQVPRFFAYKDIRSAYLEGNARFNIKHTYDERLFIVKSSGNFQIQVLGTEFDVYSGRDSSRVYLKSGSIKLISRENEDVKTILVKPQDVVKIVENKPTSIEPAQTFWQFEAWEERQFKFDATPMKEVAQMLEKQFGFKVIILDEELAEKEISGGFSWKNERDILDILSKLLDFEIDSTGNTFTLKNK